MLFNLTFWVITSEVVTLRQDMNAYVNIISTRVPPVEAALLESPQSRKPHSRGSRLHRLLLIYSYQFRSAARECQPITSVTHSLTLVVLMIVVD